MQCMAQQLEKLDPYLKYNIKSNLGLTLTSTEAEIREKLNQRVVKDGCTRSYDDWEYDLHPPDSSEFCNSMTKCTNSVLVVLYCSILRLVLVLLRSLEFSSVQFSSVLLCSALLRSLEFNYSILISFDSFLFDHNSILCLPICVFAYHSLFQQVT